MRLRFYGRGTLRLPNRERHYACSAVLHDPLPPGPSLLEPNVTALPVLDVGANRRRLAFLAGVSVVLAAAEAVVLTTPSRPLAGWARAVAIGGLVLFGVIALSYARLAVTSRPLLTLSPGGVTTTYALERFVRWDEVTAVGLRRYWPRSTFLALTRRRRRPVLIPVSILSMPPERLLEEIRMRREAAAMVESIQR